MSTSINDLEKLVDIFDEPNVPLKDKINERVIWAIHDTGSIAHEAQAVKLTTDAILEVFKQSLPKKDFSLITTLENPSWDEMRKQAFNMGFNEAITQVEQIIEGEK